MKLINHAKIRLQERYNTINSNINNFRIIKNLNNNSMLCISNNKYFIIRNNVIITFIHKLHAERLIKYTKKYLKKDLTT